MNHATTPTHSTSTRMLFAGLGAALAGVATIFVTTAVSESHTLGSAMLRVGTIIALTGMGVLHYAAIRSKGRSIEEAYRLGYDIGFENGFQAHVDDLIERMESGQPGEPAARTRAMRRRRAAERREHPAVTDLAGR